MKRAPFLDQFVAGLLIGFVFANALFWIFDSDLRDEISKNYLSIGGILAAIFAAYLALLGVRRQIGQQAELFESNRQANLAASRAALPLALSRVYSVCEKATDHALRNEAFWQSFEGRKTVLQDTELDDSTIETIKDCIRFADETSAAWLSILVSRYQICSSSHLSLMDRENLMLLDSNRTGCAVQWSILRIIASHLLDFSRGEDQSVSARLNPDLLCLNINSEHWGYPIHTEASERLVAFRAEFGDGHYSQYQVRNPFRDK